MIIHFINSMHNRPWQCSSYGIQTIFDVKTIWRQSFKKNQEQSRDRDLRKNNIILYICIWRARNKNINAKKMYIYVYIYISITINKTFHCEIETRYIFIHHNMKSCLRFNILFSFFPHKDVRYYGFLNNQNSKC